MNTADTRLIDNEDYRVSISLDRSREQAVITCSCGVKVRLTKDRSTFSLSNYYKHLKSKSCAMMKKRRVPRQTDETENNPIDPSVAFNDERSQSASITQRVPSSAPYSITVGDTNSPKRAAAQDLNTARKHQRTSGR